MKSKITGKIFVMKKEFIPTEGKERRRHEIKALRLCDHPNIVKYFEDFYEKNLTMIIMEYCTGGDLAKVIDQQKRSGSPFQNGLVISYASDLTSAMHYMRNKRIIHRDLKDYWLTTILPAFANADCYLWSFD